MRVIVNEVEQNLSEEKVAELWKTEWVQIPDEEGVCCLKCDFPVRFRVKTPTQLGGKCQHCGNVVMAVRAKPTMPWADAAIVVFRPMKNHNLMPMMGLGDGGFWTNPKALEG